MPWAGNYDLTQIAPGATVLFPAQVPGGLFSLGDLHAAMGEHEATFVAIECAGSATVRLDVRPGLTLETPRIETADRIFVMGLSPCGDYGAARLQAARLLYELLTREAELTPREAYAVISARGDLTLGGPAGTIVLGSVPWPLRSKSGSRDGVRGQRCDECSHTQGPSPHRPITYLLLRYRLLLSGRRAPGGSDRRKPQQGHRVVVGGNPVLALDAAAVAAMDHHLLAIRPKRDADGRHQRPARARPIPRPPQIDVAGGQAQGTVIAVPAAGDGRPHEGAAAAAFERVALVAPGPRAERDILPRSPWPRPGLASERISPHRR